MDSFNSLTIKADAAAPAEPSVDEDVINFDLYRHRLLVQQMPGYIGSETHATIRGRLAAQGITIK